MGRELNTKRSSLPGKINEKYAFIHTKLKLDHFHFNSLPFGHLLSLSLDSPRTFGKNAASFIVSGIRI